MKIWFKKLHFWFSKLAATKWGILALFMFAFADASLVPLPVTSFFLFFLFLNSKNVFKIVFSVVTGTLLGSLAGYAIGHFAWIKPDGEFTGFAHFLLSHIPGFSTEVYQKVHTLFDKWDFWILSGATATPLPYGMFSMISGVFGVNLIVFILSTTISQGIKFTIMAMFSVKFTPHFKRLAALNWKGLAIIGSAAIVAAVVVLRHL